MKKRGISEVVSSVLMIAIVVIIGGLIFTFSSSFFTKTVENSKPINLDYDIKIKSVFINSELASAPLQTGASTSSVEIIVQRFDNSSSLTGLRFKFDLGDSSVSYDVTDNLPLNPGIPVTYLIQDSELNNIELEKIKTVKVIALNKNAESSVLDEYSLV